MNLLFIDGEVVEAAQEVVVEATEAAAAQPAGGGWSFWIMILAMIAIMYFFMWRPESKRRKQMENFRNNLQVQPQ